MLRAAVARSDIQPDSDNKGIDKTGKVFVAQMGSSVQTNYRPSISTNGGEG